MHAHSTAQVSTATAHVRSVTPLFEGPPSRARWIVHVAGSPMELEELAGAARDPHLTIRPEGGGFVLQSCAFANAANAEDVRAKAAELLTWVAGAAGLCLDTHVRLAVAGIERLRADGRQHRFASVDDPAAKEADGPADVERALGWVVLACRNAEVARVLAFWGTPPHAWERLYKVYEVIRHSVGSDWQIAKKGWTSRKTLDRFTAAAYSKAEAGNGVEQRCSRARQMTLAEARGLIHGLAAAWLSAQSG